MIRIKPIMPLGSGEGGGLPLGTTTDQVPEGFINLYFSGKDSDDLLEGSINLFFTEEERIKLGLLSNNYNIDGGFASSVYDFSIENIDGGFA